MREKPIVKINVFMGSGDIVTEFGGRDEKRDLGRYQRSWKSDADLDP